MSEKKAFNLESIYDKQIFPLMGQIIAICQEHNMPFVADFQYSSDGEDENNHCTSAFLPKNRPISPELEEVYRACAPRRASMMNITTRDKDGRIVKMETIIG
jgi:hypothetical protein